MTMAEQSAITSLQASPRHTGARFVTRLARINLITGEDAAAQKYLSMLSRTLFYGIGPGAGCPDGRMKPRRRNWRKPGRD
jgi:hypothetical protein